VAYEFKVLRPSSDRPAIEVRAAGGRVADFGKRKRLLRFVASECGESPKDVLSGVFQKLRRTASTTSSWHMSRRFARTSPEGAAVTSVASDEWTWRAVGDVVQDVLNRSAVPQSTAHVTEIQ
jgi:hypothetical protein